MNALELAGLGSSAGSGESLVSWLSAGPLGSSALELVGLAPTPGNSCGPRKGGLFCPLCRLDERGHRRWYSRAEWEDPHCVICSEHAIPLIWCKAAPTRLRGMRWPAELRAEFRALGCWTQGWSSPGLGQCASRTNRPELSVLRTILMRTDPRTPYSEAWAEAQWHLWVEGWPVPPGYLFPARRRELPTRQPDRLAVMAITYRVCSGLIANHPPSWPLLPIRSRAFVCLQARLGQLNPLWDTYFARCFKRVR